MWVQFVNSSHGGVTVCSHGMLVGWLADKMVGWQSGDDVQNMHFSKNSIYDGHDNSKLAIMFFFPDHSGYESQQSRPYVVDCCSTVSVLVKKSKFFD